MARIANRILLERLIPQIWKMGEVVPFPPPPPKRAIYTCLLGALVRGFRHLIDIRLRDIAKETGLPSENQYGFRTQRSRLAATDHV